MRRPKMSNSDENGYEFREKAKTLLKRGVRKRPFRFCATAVLVSGNEKMIASFKEACEEAGVEGTVLTAGEPLKKVYDVIFTDRKLYSSAYRNGYVVYESWDEDMLLFEKVMMSTREGFLIAMRVPNRRVYYRTSDSDVKLRIETIESAGLLDDGKYRFDFRNQQFSVDGKEVHLGPGEQVYIMDKILQKPVNRATLANMRRKHGKDFLKDMQYGGRHPFQHW
jgi:hypothetical protein